MATEELVTEQFQFLGIEVKNEVLNKCVNLCEEYDIDAETFVEQWMAFSLSHLNGAPPDLENLVILERKEFSKREANQAGGTTPLEPTKRSTSAGLTVYGVAADQFRPETDVLSNYMSSSTTPKRIKREPTANTSNQQSELRPATYSPNVGNSAKYASRANAGSVVHSYGEERLLQNLAKPNDLNILNLDITQVPNDDGDTYTKAMFGFELLHEKASAFDNHIRYLSQCIMKKHDITESSSVRHKTQSEVCVAGRIECDADARLNPKCVVLQGTWEDSLSQVVPLDLDNVAQYSLFPGQVVVARGANPRGDRFVAREVLADASLPLPDPKADLINAFTGTMSILAVAGPYTTSDTMAYEPLKDILTYIGTHKPHVVIMTGPFMDSEHAKVRDNTMAETFKSFFEKLLDSIGEVSNASPHTKIYIISSAKDAFHVNVYPTPPYVTRKKYPNVHFMPDPCTLSVSGVVVGVTSTDALMQISQEEISLGSGSDKLSRLAGHLLSQQSYSPLQPAPAGQAADAALWAAHAQLPAAPRLLILPSHFRYFVKEVNGCVVVNPEHLTKGPGGGTFARISVTADTDTDLAKGIAAQIVRI